ncbi:MAG: hypothetical protein LBR14_04195 [Clostridiales Family XIII bacterium]|jgi:hypothetical protein|nr:hypothetical protein [Clostridiales Family XIII bacterium]
MQVVEIHGEEQYVEDFVRLPEKLYPKRYRTQNPHTERALLAGTHPLSKYFNCQAFLVYDGEEAVARFALTTYPEDETAYLGFFECADDREAGKAVFDAAEACARAKHCRRIAGPLDASFWLGYRMKTDGFDRLPFFGEPYNKAYYPRLWETNGYAPLAQYISNLYPVGPFTAAEEEEQRFTRHEKRCRERGYRIEDVTGQTFDAALKDIFEMLSELYAVFPLFKPIEWADFQPLFAQIKPLLDFSLVKMAYKDGAPVGFTVTVPDHGPIPPQPGLADKLRIARGRKHAAAYVALYVGVRKGHEGLAPAMLQQVRREAGRRKAAIIAALIRAGKVTGGYLNSAIEEETHYALYAKDVR